MKKRVLAIALVAAMAASLAACGSKQEAAPAPAPEKAEESAAAESTGEGVTIKYAFWADSDDYKAEMDQIIANFNETNESGITVVGEFINWDNGEYTNTLFQQAQGGSDIDCAAWKLASTPIFVQNDLLLDLTDLVAGWDNAGDIEDSIWQAMKDSSASTGVDGTFVMPWNIQVLYVYYIKSIFEAAGIESTPATYDELIADIKAIGDADLKAEDGSDVIGWAFRGAGGQEPWTSFIYGAGGSYDDLTSADSVAGMQALMDLYEGGYFGTSDCLGWGLNELKDELKAKRAAMTVHHTGSMSEMVEALGDDLGVFPFPAGKGQWTSMGDTDNVIFSSCANPEAAFEWLCYLATGQGQVDWCNKTGNIPVSNTVGADFMTDNEFVQASINSIGFAGIIPINDNTNTWKSDVWGPTMEQAFLGQISAEEAMQAMADGLYAE